LRGGEQVRARTLKVELKDKLPRDFDPSEIDYRLLAGEDQITLLGIALLDPTSELVKKADLVINSVHRLLIGNPEIKSVGAEFVSHETELPKEEVAIIFRKLGRVGYFHDSGSIYGHGIDGLLTINIDTRTFDAYLKYESLEGILDTLIDDDSALVNSTPTGKETLTHANQLYDKVKDLIQNKTVLDKNRARIIVESVDDAIKEFGSTNQEKKVELREWKAQAELVLPPGTLEDLRKRAEGELLKKSYPQTPILRKLLLSTIAVVVIVIGLLSLKSALSSSNNLSNVNTIGAGAPASSESPDYSNHAFIVDPQVVHPLLRERANQLIDRARAQGIPLFYFETYRTPKQQHDLYMIGRRDTVTIMGDGREVNEKEAPVTNADAWGSPMQYGLAVKVLPFGGGQWNLNPDQAIRSRLSALASSLGLRVENPSQGATFMLPNVRIDDLKAGHYPNGGDRSWADNLNGNITAWGSQEPKAPPVVPTQ
jgi:peptidoglycan L-alanyl-D-glutamate endopeptidase CwlK